MKEASSNQVIGILVSSVVSHEGSCKQLRDSPHLHVKQGRRESLIDRVSKFSKKAECFFRKTFSKKAVSYVQGIHEHVSLGPKISTTVKGKLSLGASILQAGGTGRFYRQAFSVAKGEKLLKASQCYLSTTAGPIAGMFFISNKKITFHSERSLALTSPNGDLARVPYKVVIPLERIKKAESCEDSVKPNEKYLQILTVDAFEFWFMGFFSYQKIFKCLQQIIPGQQLDFYSR